MTIVVSKSPKGKVKVLNICVSFGVTALYFTDNIYIYLSLVVSYYPCRAIIYKNRSIEGLFVEFKCRDAVD